MASGHELNLLQAGLSFHLFLRKRRKQTTFVNFSLLSCKPLHKGSIGRDGPVQSSYAKRLPLLDECSLALAYANHLHQRALSASGVQRPLVSSPSVLAARPSPPRTSGAFRARLQGL